MTDLESAAAEIVRGIVRECHANPPVDEVAHTARIIALAQGHFMDILATFKREETAERMHGIMVESGRVVGWREMPPAVRREHSPL